VNVAQKTDFGDDLAQLQVESLKTIALFAGVIGFTWYLWAGHPGVTGPAIAGSWVGVGTLVLSAILSYALKDRSLRVATHLLIWGIIGGIACGMLAFPFPGLVYLFIVPIIFSSVLLGQPVFLLVSGLVVSLILVIGSTRLGMPVPSVEIWCSGRRLRGSTMNREEPGNERR
jgi:hypothetical protein